MSAAARLETPPDRAPDPELQYRVRSALDAGALVAFATETVYGVAARADQPEALARLREAKGRDVEHVFTWHVADTRALGAFPKLPRIVERLADRYWPGPLTLVLEGTATGAEALGRNGWTGLRLPAHPVAQSLIEAAGGPLVMTSANRTGEAPATDADAVESSLGEALELIVDSGPARLAESSSVLQVGEGRFQLLREGLLSIDELRRTAGLAIGFVCTGNTCRSPMAEALARHKLNQRLTGDPRPEKDLLDAFGFSVRSAGVFAGPGAPASAHSVEALAERGVDLAGHRSSPTIPEQVMTWDRVYCMTASHLDALLQVLPPTRAPQIDLLDPEGRDVPDPIGGSLADYRACADHIESCIELRLDEWA